MNEEWRVIETAPDYVVSSLGRVLRVGKAKSARIGRILEGSPDKDGYLMISLSSKNKSVKAKIHHLVLLAFVGPRPSPEFGCAHNDNNRTNNCANNLSWKTQKDNINDKKRHGTHGLTLLESEVRDIKFRRKLGYTYVELASLFDCSKGAIAAISQGRTWKHLHDYP